MPLRVGGKYPSKNPSNFSDKRNRDISDCDWCQNEGLLLKFSYRVVNHKNFKNFSQKIEKTENFRENNGHPNIYICTV